MTEQDYLDRIQLLEDELVAARADVTLLDLKLSMIDDLVQHGVNARTQQARLFLECHRKLQEDMARLKRPAEFYLKMQEMILESDLLQDEWTRFLSFLKLSFDDLPGYTSPEPPESRFDQTD